MKEEFDLGSIYFDNYNVKDYNLKWIPEKISNANQNSGLFDISIKENIKYD